MSRYLVLLLPLAFLSCGQVESTLNTTAEETECGANVANIRVGDGYLQRDCGCQEGGKGDVFIAGQQLKCTVSAGSTVFFHFVGFQHLHQIVSTGSPTFPSSPLSDPNDPHTMLRDHAIVLTAPGDYEFTDALGGLFGSLYVQ